MAAGTAIIFKGDKNLMIAEIFIDISFMAFNMLWKGEMAKIQMEQNENCDLNSSLPS